MDSQTLIDLLFGALFAILGWFGRMLWAAMQELRKDVSDISRDVGKLEVKLAEEYTPAHRFEAVSEKMFSKLDKITELLNGKADKEK